MNNLTFRTEPVFSDIEAIRNMVISTGFFYEHEIPVAVELIETRLNSGIESGYFFIFAEIDNLPVAYSCFGEIPCTRGAFDLYWIVTHNNYRGKGVGKLLLEETNKQVKQMGGRLVIAETSSLPKYEPTRNFYVSNNYILESEIVDFYDLGDNKLSYIKRL